MEPGDARLVHEAHERAERLEPAHRAEAHAGQHTVETRAAKEGSVPATKGTAEAATADGKEEEPRPDRESQRTDTAKQADHEDDQEKDGHEEGGHEDGNTVGDSRGSLAISLSSRPREKPSRGSSRSWGRLDRLRKKRHASPEEPVTVARPGGLKRHSLPQASRDRGPRHDALLLRTAASKPSFFRCRIFHLQGLATPLVLPSASGACTLRAPSVL